MNADGSGNRQLTFTGDRQERQPSVSPDGQHIVFLMYYSGLSSIWRMGINGGGAKELVRNIAPFAEPVFSQDSQWVYYNAPDERTTRSFWKVSFEGGQPVKVRDNHLCRMSRDGKLLACSYIEAVAEADTKLVIVNAADGDVVQTLKWPGDTNAVYWSPDAQGLDYIANREGVPNIYRLTLATGKEQRLTDWQVQSPLWHFAWSADGKQLAVVRDTHTTELLLIENFK